MMENELKTLFLKADAQLPVDERRKQRTYEALLEEIQRRKRPVMSRTGILLGQIRYMDKLYFAVYGVLICIGLIAVAAMQHMEMEKSEMIMSCMIGSGLLSMLSVCMIDRLIFGEMAELGASCYFNTRQCVVAYLSAAGIINLAVLFFISVCVGSHLGLGLMRVGLYVLTPYLTSNLAALVVLSMERGTRVPYSLGICSAFLSVGYGIISRIPGAFAAASLGIWGIVFAVAGILSAVQLRKLFRQIERGETVCMN